MTLGSALAVLGLLVLLGLGLHGWWSTRRVVPSKVRDSVIGADRVEPSLDGDAAAAADAADFQHTSPQEARSTLRRQTRLDALIDALVPMALDAPVSGEQVLQHQPASRRAGSKPVGIEGLDVATGLWELPVAGGRYSELQAGVLLVNRSGALNDIEYSEFVQKVEAFAQAVGASTELPDMLEVVARARELDGLASPLDAQLNVTLRSNGVAWSVAYVQQIAGRLGFVPGLVRGRLVLPAPEAEAGAPPMLVLSVDAQAALSDDPQTSAVRECLLSLDAPQTAQSLEPFPMFHRVATALAADLDATAVDNEGQAITLHAYSAIGNELEQLYRQLEALDLAAGSPAARRVFS